MKNHSVAIFALATALAIPITILIGKRISTSSHSPNLAENVVNLNEDVPEEALLRKTNLQVVIGERDPEDQLLIQILQCENRIKILRTKKGRWINEIEKGRQMQKSRPSVVEFATKELKKIEAEIGKVEDLQQTLKEELAQHPQAQKSA